MKLITFAIFYLLNIPYFQSAVMLECALGRVDELQCPVDGGWTLWSVWGSCEGECGTVGREIRTRNCSNPRPARNGVLCSGNQREVKACGVRGCTYEQYQRLLAESSIRSQQLRALRDAAGTQNALLTKCVSSHCDYLDVKNLLGPNSAKFWNALQCVRKNTGCPVFGGWGEWSEWTRCSARCGPGHQMRCRMCCEPKPSTVDLACNGDPCDFQECTGTDCVRGGHNEGAWSEWSEWSICNAPCSLGITRRSRICQKAHQSSKRKISSHYSDSNNVQPEVYNSNDQYYDNYFYNNYVIGEKMNDYAELVEDINDLWRLSRSNQENNNNKRKYYSTEVEDYPDFMLRTQQTVSDRPLELDDIRVGKHILNLVKSSNLVNEPIASEPNINPQHDSNEITLNTNPALVHLRHNSTTKASTNPLAQSQFSMSSFRNIPEPTESVLIKIYDENEDELVSDKGVSNFKGTTDCADILNIKFESETENQSHSDNTLSSMQSNLKSNEASTNYFELSNPGINTRTQSIKTSIVGFQTENAEDECKTEPDRTTEGLNDECTGEIYQNDIYESMKMNKELKDSSTRTSTTKDSFASTVPLITNRNRNKGIRSTLKPLLDVNKTSTFKSNILKKTTRRIQKNTIENISCNTEKSNMFDRTRKHVKISSITQKSELNTVKIQPKNKPKKTRLPTKNTECNFVITEEFSTGHTHWTLPRSMTEEIKYDSIIPENNEFTTKGLSITSKESNSRMLKVRTKNPKWTPPTTIREESEFNTIKIVDDEETYGELSKTNKELKSHKQKVQTKNTRWTLQTTTTKDSECVTVKPGDDLETAEELPITTKKLNTVKPKVVIKGRKWSSQKTTTKKDKSISVIPIYDQEIIEELPVTTKKLNRLSTKVMTSTECTSQTTITEDGEYVTVKPDDDQETIEELLVTTNDLNTHKPKLVTKSIKWPPHTTSTEEDECVTLKPDDDQETDEELLVITKVLNSHKPKVVTKSSNWATETTSTEEDECVTLKPDNDQETAEELPNTTKVLNSHKPKVVTKSSKWATETTSTEEDECVTLKSDNDQEIVEELPTTTKVINSHKPKVMTKSRKWTPQTTTTKENKNVIAKQDYDKKHSEVLSITTKMLGKNKRKGVTKSTNLGPQTTITEEDECVTLKPEIDQESPQNMSITIRKSNTDKPKVVTKSTVWTPQTTTTKEVECVPIKPEGNEITIDEILVGTQELDTFMTRVTTENKKLIQQTSTKQTEEVECIAIKLELDEEHTTVPNIPIAEKETHLITADTGTMIALTTTTEKTFTSLEAISGNKINTYGTTEKKEEMSAKSTYVDLAQIFSFPQENITQSETGFPTLYSSAASGETKELLVKTNMTTISSLNTVTTSSSLNPSTDFTTLSKSMSPSTSSGNFSKVTLVSSSINDSIFLHPIYEGHNEAAKGLYDTGSISESTEHASCDLTLLLQLPNYNDSFVQDNCYGAFEEIKPCNMQPCTESGGWSSWSAWSACSPDCGLGHQVATRSCTRPTPSGQAATCSGGHTRRRSCFLHPCPVKVVTTRAMLMTGDSVLRYNILHETSSVLMLYVRFRPFTSKGVLITRQTNQCQHCDMVILSLYNGYLLLQVTQRRCHAELLSNQALTVGEWHEALVTVVGTLLTLRVDDSVLVQSSHLSCHPTAPDYDSAMKVGGRYIGEVDRLSVNFRNYALQKKQTKRDTWSVSEWSVEPVESSQSQHPVTSEEFPSANLAHFLHAPCFLNHTVWKIELAIKPQFSDGIVLFLRGSDKGEFLSLSLEQSRIRLKIRTSSISGECEQPDEVAPQTWLHITISKLQDGPIGMALNGAERCTIPVPSDIDSPFLHCTGGILLGELPLSIKKILSNEAVPVASPMGQLGSMSVDRHSLDLSRLPRKLPPDLSLVHPGSHYIFSSFTASTSVYYEEMVILHGEPLSLLCVYDLSGEASHHNLYSRDHDLDTADYSASWLKLDIPVETAFENQTLSNNTTENSVQYQISDNGKSISLNISAYSDKQIVEGFYSCWLHNPLPLQPGLNIITYGIIIINTEQNEGGWLVWLMVAGLASIIILLVALVLWLIIEAYFDFKKRSGFYRCGHMDSEKVLEHIYSMIFSKQGMAMLGSNEAGLHSYKRYKDYLATIETDTEATTDTTITDDMANTDDMIDLTDDDQIEFNKSRLTLHSESSITHQEGPKQVSHTKGPMVMTASVILDKNETPFSRGISGDKCRRESYRKRHVAETVSIEDLQESDSEETERPGGRKCFSPVRQNHIEDNLIEVAEDWKKKEVTTQTSVEINPSPTIGVIQNTSAYRNIENELKFLPEKFKELGKYEVVKKTNK